MWAVPHGSKSVLSLEFSRASLSRVMRAIGGCRVKMTKAKKQPLSPGDKTSWFVASFRANARRLVRASGNRRANNLNQWLIAKPETIVPQTMIHAERW